MKWPVRKLGELVEILSGFAFDSEYFNDREGIKIIRIRDVVRGFSQTFYNGQYDEKFIVKEGEYLVGMDGEFKIAKWGAEPALLNQRVCKLSVIDNKLDKNYLFHFLPKKLKEIEDATPFVTVKHLSVKKIADIKIPLPPLEEQRRIAEQLDAADRILRLREASIAKLDQLAQSVFVDMFGDPILNEKKYPIKSLQEVCLDKGQYGANVSASEWDPSLPRYIRITDVMDDGSLINEAVAPSGSYDEWQDYFLRKGDLLFARSGATVGKTYIHRDDSLNAVFAGYMIRFSPNLGLVEPDYLFAFTRTAFYKTWVKSRQNVVAQPNINAKQYGNELLLPIPPLEHQRKFCLFCDSINQQKLTYLKSVKEKMLLFASLQHQSFSVN